MIAPADLLPGMDAKETIEAATAAIDAVLESARATVPATLMPAFMIVVMIKVAAAVITTVAEEEDRPLDHLTKLATDALHRAVADTAMPPGVGRA